MIRRTVAAILVAVPCAAAAQDLTFKQKIELNRTCEPDIRKLCDGVSPGEGRLIACARAHEAELSPACAKLLNELAPRTAAPAAPTTPAAPGGKS